MLAVEGYAAHGQCKPAYGGFGAGWGAAQRRDFNKLFEAVDWVFLSHTSKCVAEWLGLANHVEPNRRHALVQAIINGQKRRMGNRQVARNRRAISLVKGIAALKNSEGRDILAFGDDEPSLALLVAGLIDEVHLFIKPKAVAARTSIFARKPPARQWLLSEATIYDSDSVHRKYSLV